MPKKLYFKCKYMEKELVLKRRRLFSDEVGHERGSQMQGGKNWILPTEIPRCKAVLLRLSLAGNLEGAWLWNQVVASSIPFLSRRLSSLCVLWQVQVLRIACIISGGVWRRSQYQWQQKVWARICKPFKESRNRFSALPAGNTTLFVVIGPPGYIGWAP